MTPPRNPTTPGGTPNDENAEDTYLTAEDRKRVARWQTIVAQRPPMTAEQIESVATLLRMIDTRHPPT